MTPTTTIAKLALSLALVATLTYAAEITTPPPPEPVEKGPISPVPTDLRLLSAGETIVRLTFRCGGNADGYRVFRRLASSTVPTKIAWQPSCEDVQGIVHDAGAQPQTSYCYYVQAYNTTNVSNTNEVCLNTPPVYPVVWVEAPETTRTFVFFRPRRAIQTTFQVHARRTGQTDWPVIQTLSAATLGEVRIEHAGLQPATRYEYKVSAVYNAVNPPETVVRDSSVVAATTRPATPPNVGGGCDNDGRQGECTGTFRLSNGMPLVYYRNHPLDLALTSVTRVVLVIHGLNREPWFALDQMRKASDAAGVSGETLIVAPYFGIWGSGWKEGSTAMSYLGQTPISSFTAADELLTAMTDRTRFPNVREAVIAGHSAGGQFAQRYAALTKAPALRSSIRFRFVVANPSSYMYLDAARPGTAAITVLVNKCGAQSPTVPTGVPSFSVPNTSCSSYNEYKYGLKDRYGYSTTVTEADIRRQYSERLVTYLLGELDTERDGDLDMSCEADLQGSNRLFRGTYFYEYYVRSFPEARHRRLVVPCTGHSSGDMYNSDAGRRSLFFVN